MAINIKALAAFLLLPMLLSLTSCLRDCTDTSYSFNINAQVYPDKDSIHIGDTVWIAVSTPTTSLDGISDRTVDYSGAENMGIAVQLASLHHASDTDAGTSYATEDFDYVIENGSLYTSDQYAKNYLYNEINDTYMFKLGVVPKQKGVYRLDASDAVNVYRKKHKCDKATFQLSIINTDQHFHWYNIVNPDAQPNDFAKKHYYCFKVY